MFLFLLFFGTVLALPTDEFREIVHEGDLAINDDVILKQIVPSGFSSQIPSSIFVARSNYNKQLLPNVENKDSEYFKAFFSFVDKGVTAKGLIFNIYEDDMRNAAIALFRLLKETRVFNRIDYDSIRKWASMFVNNDMYDYVQRLVALYSPAYVSEDILPPPFFIKPNYFINGETIMKALYLKNNLGQIDNFILNNYGAVTINNNIIIQSNYSGWNLPLNGCDEKISYFKDDVALNSYYYGKQLLHPFWMSNEELDEINPQHAEYYYYAHQQLLARYKLEKEHLSEDDKKADKCESEYNPYLYYENGLAFPTRSAILGEFDENVMHKLKSVDIAIRECIQRGIVVMENGTLIKVTPENYINLMTKLIRANLDGIKTAKLLRSIFGYGNKGYPINKHNPAPSVLHHPQTTLRDPVYWTLIEKGLNYFSEYPHQALFNLSEITTDEFDIAVPEHFNITTIYTNAAFNLNRALEYLIKPTDSEDVKIIARQRRLDHLPFTFNFTVESKTQKDVIVRLFLGPQCKVDSCWDMHSRFVELDNYQYKLNKGSNIISWTTNKSEKYFSSKDEFSIFENEKSKNNYNIFKFPKNLAIPKGSKEGLNLTGFIMITEDYGQREMGFIPINVYQKIYNKLDNKPLGFPFHNKAEMSDDFAAISGPNFKFFDVSVFHNPTNDLMDIFSAHLN